MISGIYQIKCNINNKIYVGSSKDIHERWKSHIRSLRANNHHNPYLQHTFNKYGLGVFVFEIIEECSKDDLITKEQYYLDLAFLEDNTFNIAELARAGTVKHHTIETKDKIGKANKGRKYSDEVRQKMSENKQGKKRPPMTEEQKLTMSIALKKHHKQKKEKRYLYLKYLAM